MQQVPTYLFPLVVLAGAGIPVMAMINANLGVQLGSPIGAVLILSLVTATVAGLLFLAVEGFAMPNFDDVSRGHMTPGLLFLFYVLTVTTVAPRLGLGNSIVLVLSGQLISAALIDQFAMLGAPRAPLTPPRIVGLTCIVVGAYLSLSSSFD